MTTSAEIERVQAEDLLRYLLARQWHEHPSAGYEGIVIVEPPEGERMQIAFPTDPDFGDYRERIAEAVERLARFESRNPNSVVDDVLNVGYDVHQVKLLPNTESGSAPMIGAAIAVSSLRDLLISSAIHETIGVEAKPILPTKPPANVGLFMQGVLLMTPTPGSFILRAKVPVVDTSQQLELFAEDIDTFGRRVNNRVLHFVKAASALSQTSSPGAVDDVIEQGMSANVLEALVGLGGRDGWPYQFEEHQTPGTNAQILEPITFEHEQLNALGALAKALRQRTDRIQISAIGSVVRLHREGDGRDVTVLATAIEGAEFLGPLRLWMNLSADDHDTAITAYERQLPVRVGGTLVRTSGQRDRLTDVSLFDVVPMASSEDGA